MYLEVRDQDICRFLSNSSVEYTVTQKENITEP